MKPGQKPHAARVYTHLMGDGYAEVTVTCIVRETALVKIDHSYEVTKADTAAELLRQIAFQMDTTIDRFTVIDTNV